MSPINPPRKREGAHYIITAIDYLNRWDESTPIKDCTIVTVARFMFDHVVNRFGCPKILISDKGTHFVNHLIDKLIGELHIHHQKTKPYHPQVNVLSKHSIRSWKMH